MSVEGNQEIEMSKNLAGVVCLNHPNVPAVARCATCSKPICAECAQVHDGVTYCSQLCYENAMRTGLMVKDVERRKGAANAKRMLVKLIWLIIILALAAGGYYYYKNHKSQIDAKVKNVKQSVESGIEKGKKKVDDNLIRDSKYKKQREAMVK